MHRLRASAYLGREVVGPSGKAVGVVADVWPLDGGGEPELVLVHAGRRFRRRHYLPLDARSCLDGGVLRVPWSHVEIDASPDAEDRRWGDPAHIARAYWRDSSST